MVRLQICESYGKSRTFRRHMTFITSGDNHMTFPSLSTDMSKFVMSLAWIAGSNLKEIIKSHHTLLSIECKKDPSKLTNADNYKIKSSCREPHYFAFLSRTDALCQAVIHLLWETSDLALKIYLLGVVLEWILEKNIEKNDLMEGPYPTLLSLHSFGIGESWCREGLNYHMIQNHKLNLSYLGAVILVLRHLVCQPWYEMRADYPECMHGKWLVRLG